MVPADTDNIGKEFGILMNELKEFNPELLDKQHLLAISKSDLLDDELKDALKTELPEGIPYVFISSHTGAGLVELKDMLWRALNTPA
jgi:GTP-binding protein